MANHTRMHGVVAFNARIVSKIVAEADSSPHTAMPQRTGTSYHAPLPTMRDMLLVAIIATTFAVAVTAYVAVLASLVRQGKTWHALAGLLLPPLSLVWAYTGGMRIKGTVLLSASLIYTSTVIMVLVKG